MAGWTRRAVLGTCSLLVAGCSGERRDADPRQPSRSVRNWTTAGYDAANTGHVPATGPVGEHAEDWRLEVDSRADILASPLVVDGAVYAGSGRTIYSLSLEDGTRRWATETAYDTGFLSGAVVDATLVVSGLAADGGAVLALDAATGAVEWRHAVAVATAPTVVDDRIYVGTADPDRALTAVDVDSGEEVWSVSFGADRAVSAVRSAPAVRGETVYTTTTPATGSASTVLGAVGTDGTEQWRVTLPGETNAAPAVDDATVYLGTSEGTVHAIGTATGETRWSTTVAGPVYSSPAVDDDHVYLGTLENALYAIDRTRGSETWSADVGVLYTDPVVTDGTVYVGGEAVQARDKEAGTGRWSYDMFPGGHAEFTSPAVVDGALLVGACAKERQSQPTYDNYVLRLGPSGTPTGE